MSFSLHFAQADLSLCWSHIPHCLKSHALAHNYECIGESSNKYTVDLGKYIRLF